MSRIVLFGATGLTGRLTAEALVKRGRQPVLGGRSRDRLDQTARELGEDLDVVAADASDPASLEDLVDRGDVLLSTVGPFVRWGDPPVKAAIRRGAHYLDSNGEPPFNRRIFDHHGPRAAEAGVGLL